MSEFKAGDYWTYVDDTTAGAYTVDRVEHVGPQGSARLLTIWCSPTWTGESLGAVMTWNSPPKSMHLSTVEELAIAGVGSLVAHAGFKDRKDKLRYGLMPFGALDEVVKVLGYGAQKPGYSDNNWQRVEGAEELYAEAAVRHLSKLMQGETRDAESGLLHAAHAACNLLFAIWFQLKRGA
jgi:hypothetical protein